MRWQQAFDSAMRELRETRGRLERLDDPTVGLSALHGEITQSRIKIQEAVLNGVTGLREENREVRRRQDRMINDLNETRNELRQLLDLADTLRSLAPPRTEDPDPGSEFLEEVGPPAHQAAAAPGAATAEGVDEPEPYSAIRPHEHAGTENDQQEETVENIEQQPQSTPKSDEKDLALKNAIEAAYQGVNTSAQVWPGGAPEPGNRAQDPEVIHGTLLLRVAGVASIEVVAHRDSWEWLTALAVKHPHFRTPPAVEEIKDGRVQTVLSGRSLIAMLIELWNTRATAAPLEGDWALATTSYHRIADELSGVTSGGETVRVVLDDGVPHSGDE